VCDRRWCPDGASARRTSGTTVVDGGHGVTSRPPAVVVQHLTRNHVAEHIVVDHATVDHATVDD
jgi:hypothetical protein